MAFATLDMSRIKGGTAIGWCWWPGTKGETLTSIRGCKWAKYYDPTKQQWVYYETCANCYAQNTAHSLCTRFDSPHYKGLTKETARGPIWNGKIRFDEQQLLNVLSMRAPRTFFLTSMGDLFYGEVPDEVIEYHFAVMIMAHWHRFLVLTKRPDRMARLWSSPPFWQGVVARIERLKRTFPKKAFGILRAGGIPNIWPGTSIENRASAEWALHHLQHVPSDNRWVSFEPMLEYVKFGTNLGWLKWVVLGGPSKQRPGPAPEFDIHAAAGVLQECKAAGVAAFLKQLGSNPVCLDPMEEDLVPVPLAERDNHNADPQHWPADLRVQQFPVPA